MKKIGISLFIIAAIFVVTVWIVDYSETLESHFDTYQQLVASDLINKGWVPSFVPRSAYDIYEKHRVDVGAVDVRFRYQPGDTKDVESSCVAVNNNDPAIQRYRCRHALDTVVVSLGANGQGRMLSE